MFPKRTQSSNDPVAWIVEWQGPIYNMIYRTVGNRADAEDLTQDACGKLLEEWQRGSSPRNERAWVFAIATNRVRDWLRASQARHRREQEVVSRRDQPPHLEEDVLVERELSEQVAREVAQLPEEQRLPLILHYFNDLTLNEVGRALDIPRTTAHSRIQSGLSNLRGRLATAAVLPAIAAHKQLLFVESTLRGAPTISVPPALAESLAQLAQALPAVSWPITLGWGTLMLKNSLLTLSLISLISLLVGIGVARLTAEPATIINDPEAASRNHALKKRTGDTACGNKSTTETTRRESASIPATELAGRDCPKHTGNAVGTWASSEGSRGTSAHGNRLGAAF